MLHLQKKKSRPESVQLQKKKVEVVKDTHVERGAAEIFTLNTPTKTREKVEINGKYFHIQVDTGSDNTYSRELLAWFRKAEDSKVNLATKIIRWYHN